MQAIVWIVAIACVLLSALFVVLGNRDGGRNGKFTVGVLCLAAVLAGVPVGLLIYTTYTREYMRLDGGATYRNVSPSDPASSHSDATMLEFVDGSVVDRDSSVGYMKSGTVYCAAPVVTSGSSSSSVVEHWAVGVDCCDQKGGFKCHKVEDSSARSGIVAAHNLDFYTNAARMSTSIFNTPEGSGEYDFVKWVKDLGSFKDDLLVSAVSLLVAAALIHLVASVCAGYMLAKVIARQVAAKR